MRSTVDRNTSISSTRVFFELYIYFKNDIKHFEGLAKNSSCRDCLTRVVHVNHQQLCKVYRRRAHIYIQTFMSTNYHNGRF